MRLREHYAKRILGDYGIAVPKGQVTRGVLDECSLKFPVVVKAQVLAGGRGKAGGIRRAENGAELRSEILSLLARPLLGSMVDEVLVEQFVPVSQELYAACAVSRKTRQHALMVSTQGGMDVESQRKATSVVQVDPLLGLRPYHLNSLVSGLDLPAEIRSKLAELVTKLYKVFLDTEAMIVEVNPVGVVGSDLMALDAKIILDDGALGRHHNILPANPQYSAGVAGVMERFGLYGGESDGRIAVLTGGAGRMMATLDLLVSLGGSIGAFGEVGRLVFQPDDLVGAMREILPRVLETEPKVVFFNTFLVLARCQDFAKALAVVLADIGPGKVPVLARIAGNGVEEAREILKGTPLLMESDLIRACKTAVHLSGGDTNASLH